MKGHWASGAFAPGRLGTPLLWPPASPPPRKGQRQPPCVTGVDRLQRVPGLLVFLARARVAHGATKPFPSCFRPSLLLQSTELNFPRVHLLHAAFARAGDRDTGYQIQRKK